MRYAATIVGVLALTLSACGPGEDDDGSAWPALTLLPGAPCRQGSDCGRDMACHRGLPGGACVLSCERGCPAGSACREVGDRAFCLATCESTAVCRPGWACEEGACLPARDGGR